MVWTYHRNPFFQFYLYQVFIVNVAFGPSSGAPLRQYTRSCIPPVGCCKEWRTLLQYEPDLSNYSSGFSCSIELHAILMHIFLIAHAIFLYRHFIDSTSLLQLRVYKPIICDSLPLFPIDNLEETLIPPVFSNYKTKSVLNLSSLQTLCRPSIARYRVCATIWLVQKQRSANATDSIPWLTFSIFMLSSQENILQCTV